ncbi:MAG TPA: cell division protein FtsZ [Polyangiaceae bacterium]|nr:cell division protein FtsZ [Polyangiaceae bacterium]
MSFSIEFADEQQEYQARIKVIGCGGSGGNAVNTMINFGLEGVEFIVVNTDAQALNANFAPTKLNIGGNVTKGLGAGADPERGRKAALEDVQRIKELITGADMVFVTAGMGGGTGTGAAPVIAQLAREEGALTVGVVTKPFLFEGRQRARRAEVGLASLAEHVDTLITIPNQKLLLLGDEDLTFIDAFRKADEVLYQAVKGISDLITQNGIVNVDFADVKTVMSERGRALMGTGIAKGQNRARMAAEMAITSPLLDDISVEGATGILINIVGGPDLKMREIQEAASLVQEQADEDANIIFGSSVDESLGENVKVTVIATGFDVADRALLQEAAARGQIAAPQPIPVHQLRDSSYNMRAPAYPSMRPQAPAYPEQHVPAVSRRSPPPQYQQPAPASPQSRLPLRETQERGRADRNSSFPNFETDWDVPAFQRKHGG